MTPAARQAAAIAILDRTLAGQSAEQALTQWARGSRFAGSGDREAVRDLVFSAIRQRRSAQVLGGGETGRALLLGLRRADAAVPGSVPDPVTDWTGAQHSPAPLDATEQALFASPTPPLTRAEALDCPDWLLPHFDAALGERADAVLSLMRGRAPVFLRVNAAATTPGAAQAELAADGVETRPHPLARHALEVVANPRRIRNSAAYREGRVELQDAASQAVTEALVAHLTPGTRVRVVHMKLQDSVIELFDYSHPQGREPRPDAQQSDYGLTHIGFIVEDFWGTYQHLVDRGVQFLGEPVEIRHNVFVGYFRGAEYEVCEIREIVRE